MKSNHQIHHVDINQPIDTKLLHSFFLADEKKPKEGPINLRKRKMFHPEDVDGYFYNGGKFVFNQHWVRNTEVTPERKYVYSVYEEVMGDGGHGQIYKIVAQYEHKDNDLAKRNIAALLMKEQSTEITSVERQKKEKHYFDKMHEDAKTNLKVSFEKDFDGNKAIGYMVEPQFPNQDLFNLISNLNLYTVTQLKILTINIIKEVAKADRLGFIHRDLKPENFIVDDQMNVRLIDFGEAREKNEIDNERVGSPFWIAHEMFHKIGTANEKSDVYSLGLILRYIWRDETIYEYMNEYSNNGIEKPIGFKPIRILKEFKDYLRSEGINPEELIAILSEMTSSLDKRPDINSVLRKFLNLLGYENTLSLAQLNNSINPVVPAQLNNIAEPAVPAQSNENNNSSAQDLLSLKENAEPASPNRITRFIKKHPIVSGLLIGAAVGITVVGVIAAVAFFVPPALPIVMATVTPVTSYLASWGLTGTLGLAVSFSAIGVGIFTVGAGIGAIVGAVVKRKIKNPAKVEANVVENHENVESKNSQSLSNHVIDETLSKQNNVQPPSASKQLTGTQVQTPVVQSSGQDNGQQKTVSHYSNGHKEDFVTIVTAPTLHTTRRQINPRCLPRVLRSRHTGKFSG